MWELHGFKAHHRVVLGCGERLGGGGSTEQGGSAAQANDGEVTPVEDGRREVARELREREAKLFAWSIWAERLWNSEATAGWSSSAFTVERQRVLGSGSEEQAKERTD